MQTGHINPHTVNTLNALNDVNLEHGGAMNGCSKLSKHSKYSKHSEHSKCSEHYVVLCGVLSAMWCYEWTLSML